MVVGRAARRESRRTRLEEEYGADAGAALDLLELLELAWHDCYGEPTFPDDVLDDVLLLAGGDLRGLVGSARLAVTDRRDLRLAADDRR